MDLELHQVELRYAQLRRRNKAKEQKILASLSEHGQQLPVVVCKSGTGYVLVDGYKRHRALGMLKQDVIRTICWQLAESEALVLEQLMRASGTDGALEQGWLLAELNERFSLSHEELARRFDKSQGWVSRRLALVRSVPGEVQKRVRAGTLPAHAAMHFFVPMARAKPQDCERILSALGTATPSTRELGTLYSLWKSGNKATRELIVTQPMIALRAQAQADEDKGIKSPGRQLLDDLGILIGASRGARHRLVRGAADHLLSTERQEANHAARQARYECEALFKQTEVLTEGGQEASDAG